MNTITTTQTYEIADRNLEEVTALVEKLNRRCVRLGLPQIKIEDKGMLVKDETIYHTIILTGVSPIINGFQFVATIDHVTTEGNVINICPFSLDLANKIGMEQYRDVNATCEHCGTLRARNSTYVVYNVETEQVKRVGKACLKDFTGHKDVHAVAEYAQELYELEQRVAGMEEEGCESGSGKNIVLYNYLKWVACSIRNHGWLSKGKAYEQGYGSATCYDALTLESMLKAHTSDISPTEQDKEVARRAIEWIRNEETKAGIGDNEYMWNLYVICKDEIVSTKHLGIGASLIAAYQKHTQKEIEKKISKPSEWLVPESAIGQKYTGLATCTRINAVDSQFGTTYIINFITEQGNKITWFASNPFNRDNTPMCVEGTAYKVSGTVKKLEDSSKYGKSTILTRCKVVAVEIDRVA